VLNNELFLDLDSAFDFSKACSAFTEHPKTHSNFYKPIIFSFVTLNPVLRLYGAGSFQGLSVRHPEFISGSAFYYYRC
jgi:hypothetical protein